MPADLPLRCACGALRGVVRGVASGRGNHVVCYCDDCQAFAHFLGRADEVLDAHGGTEIFQVSPARVEIAQGAEHLACMRLRRRGLLRWYADCCRTPVGNTLATGRIPFVGLIVPCLGDPEDGGSRDEVLGPVRLRAFARFAKGDRAQLDHAHDRAPVSFFLRFIRLFLPARLRGDQKRSPFFDAGTGEPTRRPRVLSPEELARVEAARDAA